MTRVRTSVADPQAVPDGTRFLKPYGVQVESCASGECALRVTFGSAPERPGGVVRGMTIMGAADVAVWWAIMTLRGTEEHRAASDVKTAFLRSGRREDVLCPARIVKLGRRTAYGTVECQGAASGLLARHVVTYAKVAT